MSKPLAEQITVNSPQRVPGQKMSGTAALSQALLTKTGTLSSYSKAQEKE